MAVVPKEDGQLLPVVACKGFMEDPNFEQIRQSASKPGGAMQLINKIIEPSSVATNITYNTDSLNFLEDRFELVVDARGYNPENLKCSMTADTVEVTGETEKKQGGCERRMTMSRFYQLPQAIKPEEANCLLSEDGVLVIIVPWKSCHCPSK